MKIILDPNSVEDYQRFLQIKKLPTYSIVGRECTVPDEYGKLLGLSSPTSKIDMQFDYMFDYQAALTRLAIRKRKFALFVDCGYGKSLIMLAYAQYVQQLFGGQRKVLIITPPLVVRQIIGEAARFLPELKIEQVKASQLAEWMTTPGDAVGVTNYEALKDDTPQGLLGALILDESSILKSHYGKYGQTCLRLGRGLEWKLSGTGTPAPNDRIEFANQAVFLDKSPSINSFLAKYFINRGQTQDRWTIKAHAIKPFYRSLSEWSFFLSNPGTYGWKDNASDIPPIHTHIHHIDLSGDQRQWMHDHLGTLVATRAGGIATRGAYGQVAKGKWKGTDFETLKPAYIANLIDGWRREESTIVWCLYDAEQRSIEQCLGEHAASMDGSTSMERRVAMVDAFKSREVGTIISKPQILGFGLNLQVATRQVFSGLQDSYEKYYQCVKRSNRVGSTRPLNVHIPITELEEPMIDTVLRKAKRVEEDTREQESLFKASGVFDI